MFSKKIAASCVAVAVIAGASLPAGASASTAASAPVAPTFSTDGGRFTAPATVELSAETGTEIRYTLDGSTPTENSPLYTGPIEVAQTSNLTAVAFRDGASSPVETEGYIIKTEEEPLLSYFVLSDVHTSQLNDSTRGTWASHFNALAAINPNPDLIISNGDQINDNHWNTAPDHQVVKTIFDENIERLGLHDTAILMSHGNHDVGNADMHQYYGDWFPNGTGGYYEKDAGEYTFLVTDTESYSGAQRTWLRERLAALSAEPGGMNRPIFVVGHRPVPNTVHDGAQASNPALRADLAEYPQAVFFSGHSHLNSNDERSIWQDTFTAINGGSMSYTETARNIYQMYPEGLVEDYTIATAQGLYVEVYADRTEIDRINFAADPARTSVDGVWVGPQSDFPFVSAGTVAGPTWVIDLDGSTAEEIRANFDYTSAARDVVAPTQTGEPAHSLVDGADVLRIPAATDDESVYAYDVRVRDAATGAQGLPLRQGAMVLSDFHFSPRPSVLDVPLTMGDGTSLQFGTEYLAEVIAVDMYGNRSESRSVSFVAGEDTAALPADVRFVSVPAEIIAGTSATLTTRFTNQTDAPLPSASLSLGAPEGWMVEAVDGSSLTDVAAGESRVTTWRLTAPKDADDTSHPLAIEARFTTPSGEQTLTRSTSIVVIPEGTIPRSRLSIAGFSSENSASEAAINAIDGDPQSIWHSTYAPEVEDFPHWLTIDLGAAHLVDGLGYLQRQDSGANGNIKDYEIRVSDDNITWSEPIHSGTFANGKDLQQASFAETSARYVRLTGLNAQNGQEFGAAAEITMFGVIEAAPDTTAPETTLVSPDSEGPLRELVVQIDATDGGGLKEIVADVYRDETLHESTRTLVEGTSGTHRATLALADGEYEIEYTAEDAAGNRSEAKTVAVMIDATAPTVTVNSEAGATTGTEADGYDEVSFDLRDDGGLAAFALNGAAQELEGSSAHALRALRAGALGAVAGSNTLEVSDRAGNTTTVTFVLNDAPDTPGSQPGGALATTGGAATIGLTILAVLLIAGGAGFVILRRRSSNEAL